MPPPRIIPIKTATPAQFAACELTKPKRPPMYGSVFPGGTTKFTSPFNSMECEGRNRCTAGLTTRAEIMSVPVMQSASKKTRTMTRSHSLLEAFQSSHSKRRYNGTHHQVPETAHMIWSPPAQCVFKILNNPKSRLMRNSSIRVQGLLGN